MGGLAALAAAVAVTALSVYLREPEHCGGALAAGGTELGGALPPVDSAGRRHAADEPLDGPALLYFGYTYCPDICPLDVERMSEATYELDARGLAVTPMFATIDPQRDGPAEIGEFLTHFHPRFEGRTGTAEEVARSAQAWRVYYARGEGDGEDYLMDHSAFVYLANAGGKYVAHFARGVPVEEVADTVECHARAGRIAPKSPRS